MADSLKTKEELDRLKKFKGDFVADFEAEEEWRNDKIEYGKFYDGDQLSEDEMTELEKRGQPAVVINRIKPKMDAIFGIQQGLRVDTKCYPKGDREEEAELISEELRAVEDDSAFDDLESLAFEDLGIDGRGWYEVGKEWDGLDSRDKIYLASNDSVVLDKHCPPEERRTGEFKNTKRLHKTAWVELEDAQGMFPAFAKELEDAVNSPELAAPMIGKKLSEFDPDQYQQPTAGRYTDPDVQEFLQFVDKKKKRVRLVTTYYRKPYIQRFVTHSAGTVDVTNDSESDRKKILETFPKALEWTQTNYKLHTATFTWNAILEEKNDLRPYDKQAKFPLILVPGYVTRDEKQKHYGLIKQQMDPQREVNKRRSKMLHLLNTNQTWFEEGAFENESKSREEIARPDGFVKYRKEFKVDNIKHLDLATSQFQLLQESKNEIDTAGVNREIEGRSNSGSGREFQLRQQQAMQSIRKLFMNLRGARRRVAEYILDEILNRHPELQISAFDIVIEEAPDTINLQSETFETLSGLAMKGLPIPPDMLIEVSPLPTKTKQNFIQRMQEQAQMQAQMAQAQAQAQVVR